MCKKFVPDQAEDMVTLVCDRLAECNSTVLSGTVLLRVP